MKFKVLMIDSLIGNDYTLCLCSSLSRFGADITLIVPENKEIRFPVNFVVKRIAPTKDNRYSKKKKLLKFIQYFLILLKLIIKGKNVIVHYQFFRNKIETLFYILLKLLGANLIHTAHNVLPHETSKIDYILYFLIYKSSNMIIAHSNYIKNELSKKFKIKVNKIIIIPHGNFDIYLPPKGIDKNLARKYFGLSNEDDVILFFGYIRENKGLDLLLDAFEIVAESNPRLKLIIAGSVQSNKLRKNYEQKISIMKSRDRIVKDFNFITFNDVAQYFLAADIVALPYKNIYHSGVVHLAYSFGRPIIATRVGDFEEMTENGQSGYLTPENETTSFARTIIVAFSNKSKLLKMGQYAKKLSQSKYSWNEIAHHTGKLYENIIKSNRCF